VIVFARFPSETDHRYLYARWTGTEWAVNEITPAGGTIRGDGLRPYYSGGLTLDHEDPSRVYLSRNVGAGAWRVETWTTADGGASWTSQAVSTAAEKNVRPISPRMSAFDDDLGVIWMRGEYPDYVNYKTEVAALTDDLNAAPVADAEPSLRAGPAPLEVRFDAGSFSYDPDGSIDSFEWDFGDGTTGNGADVIHTTRAGQAHSSRRWRSGSVPLPPCSPAAPPAPGSTARSTRRTS
jgi:hypothetical protein